MDGYANTGPPPPAPAPLIPSAQTAFASPPGGPLSPPGVYGSPPPLGSGAMGAPPPPGPPPPPLPPGVSSHVHMTPKMAAAVAAAEAEPATDARSDLLAAIRMGKACVCACVCVCVCERARVCELHIYPYACGRSHVRAPQCTQSTGRRS